MVDERFRQIGTSHLFLIWDDKILFLRRFNTGYEDGKYSVIAGHIERNETARETIIREAKEEAGIDIDLDDLELIHVMHRNEDEKKLDFFWSTKKWRGEPKIRESQKCDLLTWFKLDNLPDNVVSYIRQAIDCYLCKKFYSEYGWLNTA